MENKKWYLMDGVEYSTDFKFFLENQVFLGKKIMTVNGYNLMGKPIVLGQTRPVFSRLQKMNFGEVECENEVEGLRKIHSRLMRNHYGDGRLVD